MPIFSHKIESVLRGFINTSLELITMGIWPVSFFNFSKKQIQVSNKYSDILDECMDAYRLLKQYSIKDRLDDVF